MSFPNQSAKANSILQSKQKVMKYAKKDKIFCFAVRWLKLFGGLTKLT